MSAIPIKNAPSSVQTKQDFPGPVSIGGGMLTLSEIDAAKRAERRGVGIDSRN